MKVRYTCAQTQLEAARDAMLKVSQDESPTAACEAKTRSEAEVITAKIKRQPFMRHHNMVWHFK